MPPGVWLTAENAQVKKIAVFHLQKRTHYPCQVAVAVTVDISQLTLVRMWKQWPRGARAVRVQGDTEACPVD